MFLQCPPGLLLKVAGHICVSKVQLDLDIKNGFLKSKAAESCSVASKPDFEILKMRKKTHLLLAGEKARRNLGLLSKMCVCRFSNHCIIGTPGATQ